MSDRVTIVINLPVTVDDFNRVLKAVGETWPHAMVNNDGENGWLVEVGPDE